MGCDLVGAHDWAVEPGSPVARKVEEHLQTMVRVKISFVYKNIPLKKLQIYKSYNEQ